MDTNKLLKNRILNELKKGKEYVYWNYDEILSHIEKKAIEENLTHTIQLIENNDVFLIKRMINEEFFYPQLFDFNRFMSDTPDWADLCKNNSYDEVFETYDFSYKYSENFILDDEEDDHLWECHKKNILGKLFGHCEW